MKTTTSNPGCAKCGSDDQLMSLVGYIGDIAHDEGIEGALLCIACFHGLVGDEHEPCSGDCGSLATGEDEDGLPVCFLCSPQGIHDVVFEVPANQ